MRADSWILRDLPELLVNDWHNGLIYVEADMQSAAYYWLRKMFERMRGDSWVIRTEPVLQTSSGNVKPDLVLYKNGAPYDFIELKCQLSGFVKNPVEKDIEKLRRAKEEFNVRHAYVIVLFDDEFRRFGGVKEEWMKNYFTFVGANVRVHPETGRPRRGYEDARKLWERRREQRVR